MNYNKIFALYLFALLFSLNACSDDDIPNSSKLFKKGFFISNEGPFLNGSGTIDFYDTDEKKLQSNIFENRNSRPLGNVVQSVQFINDNAYIVVNNADKIEIANANDFSELGVINGLKLPRYILQINSNKAYVSQWGDNGNKGEIKVLNLNNNNITKTISVGSGAETMLKKDNRVYVCNSGGFGNDSTLSIINTDSDQVEITLQVGANPNSIQMGNNGSIFVLCGGKYNSSFEIEISSSLHIIKSLSPLDTLSFSLNNLAAQASDLIINPNGDKLYFSLNGKVYSQNVNSNTLDLSEVISGSFYSLGFDPSGNLLAGDAGDFASRGKILVIQPNSGSVIDSFFTGIAPNGFYLK